MGIDKGINQHLKVIMARHFSLILPLSTQNLTQLAIFLSVMLYFILFQYDTLQKRLQFYFQLFLIPNKVHRHADISLCSPLRVLLHYVFQIMHHLFILRLIKLINQTTNSLDVQEFNIGIRKLPKLDLYIYAIF